MTEEQVDRKAGILQATSKPVTVIQDRRDRDFRSGIAETAAGLVCYDCNQRGPPRACPSGCPGDLSRREVNLVF